GVGWDPAGQRGRVAFWRNSTSPRAVEAQGPRRGDLEAFAEEAQRHRSRASPDLADDDERGAAGRRIARAYHQHGAAAILLASLRRPCNGDEPAVAQLPHPDSRMASSTSAKRTVVGAAGRGTARKPFAQRKEAAPVFAHAMPPFSAGGGGGAAVGGDQHIGLRRAKQNHDGAADEQPA